MRLTAQQQATVRACVAEVFGPVARVRLFGSRVDDTRRGCNIDLRIYTRECNVQTHVRSEIALLTKLQNQLGEQKIDLLLDCPSREAHPPFWALPCKRAFCYDATNPLRNAKSFF